MTEADTQLLRRFSDAMNRTSSPDSSSEPTCDLLAGAVIWRDEVPLGSPNSPTEDVIGVLRPLWHHRTKLTLGQTSQYADWWALGLTLFPMWVGFRGERLLNTPAFQKAHDRLQRETARLCQMD